jgi:uncharacterized repeat protein (TIGR01451 family)
MKPAFLFVSLCFHFAVYSQITFDEITAPDDFNISELRKSPIGEYFVQALNDGTSIYTSMNGQDWTKTPLPENHPLFDIQFFSDGTPVLKARYNEHLIRRNGFWHTMNASGGWEDVTASFIKEDTLFVYQDNTFSYSLDKGETFTPIITVSPGISDYRSDLWKFENHFILHHKSGASDYLSVFDESGGQILNEYLNLSSFSISYNSNCGEILFNDDVKYYLLKEQGLSFEEGNTTSIIPDFSYNDVLLSQAGNYYHVDGNTINKTDGCNFTWEVLVSDDLIQSNSLVWIDDQEDIFLFNWFSDHFFLWPNGTSQWEEHLLNINYAYVSDIDESIQGNQICLTSNALFNKNVNEADWIELDTSGNFNYQIQYSPNGDLYLFRKNSLLYSSDNGSTFSEIDLPDNGFPGHLYLMEVLDDGFLIFIDGISSQVFYTLNNGFDWISVNTSQFFITPPKIKLVGNYIFIIDLEFNNIITRININTNESEEDDLGLTLDIFTNSVIDIMDDGTVYFYGSDWSSTDTGLFSYQFGEEVEFLGSVEGLGSLNALIAAGTDLFLLGNNEYHLIQAGSSIIKDYSGLPTSGYKKFIVAEDYHLYVIIDNHRIFRSTEALFYPNFISGSVYNDSDLDCILDTLDETLQYWQIKVESDQYTQIRTTNNEGSFNFSVPEGEYTLSSQPISPYWDLCESSVNISVDENNPEVHYDFLARGLADCADLEIDFSTPFLRRCFDNIYTVKVVNTGPKPSEGTTLTLELDSFFVFLGASIPYTQIEDHIIEFDLGVLELNQEVSFQIQINLSCDADLGQEHCMTGILSDDNICQNDRSIYTECQENIGAFDPNDKRVFNEAGAQVETIEKDEYLYYHIRFQNTGTDTAFNVRIEDPLSSILDINTFKMLSSSHPNVYRIIDGPVLEVIFENILLPDSTTNEPASHGFFKFKIKPLPEYDYGTSIPNQAAIYFDFNEPIYTNEAITVIEQTIGIKNTEPGIEFDIYPNPVTNTLFVNAEINGSSSMDLSIYDLNGRQIKSVFQGYKNTGTHHWEVPVEKLVPGIYILKLQTDGGLQIDKFIKI